MTPQEREHHFREALAHYWGAERVGRLPPGRIEIYLQLISRLNPADVAQALKRIASEQREERVPTPARLREELFQIRHAPGW